MARNLSKLELFRTCVRLHSVSCFRVHEALALAGWSVSELTSFVCAGYFHTFCSKLRHGYLDEQICVGIFSTSAEEPSGFCFLTIASLSVRRATWKASLFFRFGSKDMNFSKEDAALLSWWQKAAFMCESHDTTTEEKLAAARILVTEARNLSTASR